MKSLCLHCVNEETRMFTDTVPNAFHVHKITCDSNLAAFHNIHQTDGRQNRITSDFFHVESVRYCVGKHSESLHLRNVNRDFSISSRNDCSCPGGQLIWRASLVQQCNAVTDASGIHFGHKDSAIVT